MRAFLPFASCAYSKQGTKLIRYAPQYGKRFISGSASTTPLVANYKNIPGLILGRHFTTHEEQALIEKEISELFALFRTHAKEAQAATATIPQASKNHNLPSTESFRALEIPFPGLDEPLKVEYFEKYGEEGHELAYIRGRKKGNSNLPPFAWALSRRISNSMRSVFSEIGSKYVDHPAEDMTWRLTLNFYKYLNNYVIGNGKRAGFPFHTDIQANGDETFIIGFGTPAKMEFIRHKEDSKIKKSTHEVQVEAGEIVGLTGSVRNEWLHRVVPEEGIHAKDRVSLVLGCRLGPK